MQVEDRVPGLDESGHNPDQGRHIDVNISTFEEAGRRYIVSKDCPVCCSGILILSGPGFIDDTGTEVNRQCLRCGTTVKIYKRPQCSTG